MAKTYALAATTTTTTGKGAARALRRSGRLPAVLYGGSEGSVPLSVDENAVNVEYLRGHMLTTVCALEVDGAAQKTLVRDVQRHPVTDRVIHVDFVRVTDRTMVSVPVPVRFINEDKCPGLEQKGTLAVVRREVEILCRANAIPDVIEVDLEGVENGESIHVSRAHLPEGTRPTITDRDFTIATLQAPRRAEAVEEEEAEAEVPAAEADEEEEAA
ncbi:MAG TPA: 50S ribosomal protein L25 [Rhodospirillaceae bacterium]|mgnify:CR=1 FL=1|jgi:large subunit ribosomal protein L25|nr:50S ribosomal protein L25/general stress protein Ctc [Alphaproteobacteria bacterium]HBH26107.1 50S ribosomal protein L25 [Rhodospirillaceae bacterium]